MEGLNVEANGTRKVCYVFKGPVEEVLEIVNCCAKQVTMYVLGHIVHVP